MRFNTWLTEAQRHNLDVVCHPGLKEGEKDALWCLVQQLCSGNISFGAAEDHEEDDLDAGVKKGKLHGPHEAGVGQVFDADEVWLVRAVVEHCQDDDDPHRADDLAQLGGNELEEEQLELKL